MYKIIPVDFCWGYSDEAFKEFIDNLPETNRPLAKHDADVAIHLSALQGKTGKELKVFIADIFISKWESFKKSSSITLK